MERIIKGVSDALGVKTKFRFYSGPPAVHNDKALTDLSTQVATKMNLNIISPSLSMAGEDFSFYQQEIPGSFVFMGTSGTHEWHHPAFTINEEALPISAEYFALLAERALNNSHKAVQSASQHPERLFIKLNHFKTQYMKYIKIRTNKVATYMMQTGMLLHQ